MNLGKKRERQGVKATAKTSWNSLKSTEQEGQSEAHISATRLSARWRRSCSASCGEIKATKSKISWWRLRKRKSNCWHGQAPKEKAAEADLIKGLGWLYGWRIQGGKARRKQEADGEEEREREEREDNGIKSASGCKLFSSLRKDMLIQCNRRNRKRMQQK